MNYTGAWLTGLPQNFMSVFNINQQLPSLTVFILTEPGGVLINQGHLLEGGNNVHALFLSYSLALAAGTVLIALYLILCIGALLLRNYLNKRMKGN